jgi:hypothetical protein
VQCIATFLDACYIVRHNAISTPALERFRKCVEKFHELRRIFIDAGVRVSISLPRQHALSHYFRLIILFGSPNGLCSSITESKHIKAVKEPWRRSNRFKALAQMLRSILRMEKMAALRRDFAQRGMLKGTVQSYVAAGSSSGFDNETLDIYSESEGGAAEVEDEEDPAKPSQINPDVQAADGDHQLKLEDKVSDVLLAARIRACLFFVFSFSHDEQYVQSPDIRRTSTTLLAISSSRNFQQPFTDSYSTLTTPQRNKYQTASFNRNSRVRSEFITPHPPPSTHRVNFAEWEGSFVKGYVPRPAFVVVLAAIRSSSSWTRINLAYLAWLLLASSSSSPSTIVERITHVPLSTGLFVMRIPQMNILACGR